MNTATQKMRVLHAEDDASDAFFVRSSIESCGREIEIINAATRDEFVSAINRGHLDLILADNGLPGFSGTEVLALARERCPETPVIIVSGAADERHVAAALEAGATDYVVKSQLWQLEAAIHRAQADSRQRDESARLTRHNQAMKRLVTAVAELSLARDLPTIMAITRRAARELTGADGATFILREGDKCHYADEDAIAPLWKGQKFPMSACISGWAMLNRTAAAIEDIYADPRIPAKAYRPTFVKSLVMVPIRSAEPVGAIGNYWAHRHAATAEEIELLQALAETTAVAMENVRVNSELEQRVRDRTLQLEASNKELEAFSYSVSHDLRAPLRSIGGFADLLQSEHAASLSPEARGYLARIGSEASRTSSLIDDLLRLARFTRVDLLTESVDLSRIARQITSRFETNPPARRVEFRVQDGLTVSGDPGLLRIVLQNLLANAYKYSSKHPTSLIEFGATTQPDGSAAFFVRDDGAGFDMKYADKLFKPFQRLHRQDEFPGNGIGLAMVERIVQRHGGRMRVEAAPDRGATFFFTLPAK